MAFLIDAALDAGLDYVRTNATAIYLCSQEPTTRTEAVTTYALATKASPTINVPSDRAGGGREITIAAFADGSVTATGTATHYAIVSGTELLATEALTSSQAVTILNTWEITSATAIVGFPDAT